MLLRPVLTTTVPSLYLAATPLQGLACFSASEAIVNGLLPMLSEIIHKYDPFKVALTEVDS